MCALWHWCVAQRLFSGTLPARHTMNDCSTIISHSNLIFTFWGQRRGVEVQKTRRLLGKIRQLSICKREEEKIWDCSSFQLGGFNPFQECCIWKLRQKRLETLNAKALWGELCDGLRRLSARWGWQMVTLYLPLSLVRFLLHPFRRWQICSLPLWGRLSSD